MKKPKNSLADLIKKADELKRSLEELKEATDAMFSMEGKSAK